MRRFWAGLLLLLLAGAAVARPLDYFSPAALHSLLLEIKPLLEHETRHPLVLPAIETCDVETMTRMLAKEITPQIALQVKDPKLAAANAHEAAVGMSRNILGKYTLQGHRVLIVPYNYDSLLDVFISKGPQLDPHRLMKVVVTHELVHAQDEQLYHACSHVAQLKTPTQLEIWNALLEGHAQSVTHRIFLHLSQKALFDAFVDRVMSPPAGGAASEYYKSYRFAYIDGMAFFDYLSAHDARPDLAARVFAHPPTSRDEILHPATYKIP
ncbi:MAG: hypothetical protein ACYCW6_29180 [Candidatus Xenobia bacterium]